MLGEFSRFFLSNNNYFLNVAFFPAVCMCVVYSKLCVSDSLSLLVLW